MEKIAECPSQINLKSQYPVKTGIPWVDQYFDPRNIADRFKGLENEKVKEILSKEKKGFAFAMSQMEKDFNFGCLVRSANGLGAIEVLYVEGSKGWDRRSAVGSHHYIDLSFYRTWDHFFEYARAAEYTIVALECNVDFTCIPIEKFEWPTKPLILLGTESIGLPDSVLLKVEESGGFIVQLPLFGSVRSYNAAVAGSIAMYDYLTKNQL